MTETHFIKHPSQICEENFFLFLVYKPTSQAPTSEEMVNYCSKAAPETLCKESVKKTLSSLDNQAAIMGLRLDATLIGSTKVHKILIDTHHSSFFQLYLALSLK